MYKRFLTALAVPLCASLLLLGTSSCSADAPTSTPPISSATSYDVPVTLSFSSSIEGETTPRALDFVVYDEEKDGQTNANPHLELEQFQQGEGMQVNLLFVCTSDPSQPVSIVQTTLRPESYYQTPSNAAPYTLPARTPRLERYLRTKPGTGNNITLATGTDLSRGTWKVALYYGDIPTSRTAAVDPNGLAAVAPSSDTRSDLGIRDQYLAGKYNLSPVSKSSKGQSSISAEEKTSLAVPYMSEWITITSDMLSGEGADLKVNLGRIPLRPQGTLLRIQVRNENFADIKLAGFRLLTNSIAFRGAYDFSDASLRSNAQTGDLSTLFTPQNVRGEVYADSTTRTLPFPNYADFWVNQTTAETLTAGQDSKYYLVWGMPIRDKQRTTQSRKGLLHVLLYDANRTGDQYNRSMTNVGNDATRVLPVALIRKPALTRMFPEGYFRLSQGAQAGQYFRLHGVQTRIYNFLDYMVNTNDKTYYSKTEMQSFPLGQGERVADKLDWAGIYPVKYPDNPITDVHGDRYDHYFHGAYNRASKYFNSNRLGFEMLNDEVIGSLDTQVKLILSEDDTDYYPQANTGSNRELVGKQNNKQLVRIPKEMQIPLIRAGRTSQPETITKELLFSTYQDERAWVLVGWGEGQTYLSGITYHKGYATARYLGPALHRPYSGGWSTQWPWDISFYYTPGGSRANPRDADKAEADDTWRTMQYDGYALGSRNRINSSLTTEDAAGDNMSYWSSDGNWVYLFFTRLSFNGRDYWVGSGYGQPGNATRSRLYTDADDPRAMVRKFANTPQEKGRPALPY